MIRIAFVISRLGIGGAETQLVQLVTGLDKSAFAPIVICLKDEGDLADSVRDADIPIHALGIGRGWNPIVVARLARLLSAHKPDIVHCTNFNSTLWGRLAAIWARVPKIVVAEHSTNRQQLRQKLAIPLINQVLASRTDSVVACGLSQVPALVAEGHHPDSITVIVNGVDPTRFSVPEDKHAVKRAIGLPIDTVSVGILAALRPEKNHAMFLEVGRRLLDRGARVSLVLVGDGVGRESLQDLASELGISDSVYFLGARRDVPQVLAALDVGVLTSFGVIETFPISVLEEMSAGLPVVATDVGDVSQIVVDGETGFVVDVMNADGFLDKVEVLVRDAALRDVLGSNGAKRVADCFTVGAMVEKYERLFRGLAGR